jgi:signal transduction histidine kinase
VSRKGSFFFDHLGHEQIELIYFYPLSITSRFFGIKTQSCLFFMKRIQTHTFLPFKSIAFCLLILAFCACSDKKENSSIVFPKPPDEQLDRVGTWLSDKKNYTPGNYLPYFEPHFNQQIANNNLDSAARLLYLVSYYCDKKKIYDTVVIQKCHDFLSKYDNRISPRFRSGLYRNLGKLYYLADEYEKGIAALRHNNFTPDDYYTDRNVSWSLYELAFNFSLIAQYDSAIVYGQKAMAFFEKNQDEFGQLAAYDNLRNVYRFAQNYQEAEKYAHKTLEIAKMTKDSEQIFEAYNSLIGIYRGSENPLYASTIDTLVQFERKWQHNEPKYTLMAQSRVAYRCVKDSNYVEADKILTRIAPLFPLVVQDYYNQYYISARSDYELATHKPLSLKKVCVEKLQQAKDTKTFVDILEYSDYLRQDAMSRNDHKTAYTYLQDYTAALDSFQNVKMVAQASELEKKYQTEKKEAQLKEQATAAFRKNIFIVFLLVGLAALFYFYYTVKKKNTTISQQNELNEQTIAILSHDIKEPLLGVKLMLKKLNKDDPFVAQASQSLESQINSVNGILTNLLKMKKLALTKKDKNVIANANSVVKNVIQELNVAIQTKSLTINNELTDDVVLPIAAEKLQIIVHNLLSNAVKYSFPNQQIRIYKEGKGFCIQDFGVGLSPEQRTKLMREVTASQRGTNQERGNGMGLFLVGAMLQGEQLKVVFDSPEVGGTIAKVLG